MRNLLSFNIMKKITLIFLLFANMIVSGQISEICLMPQDYTSLVIRLLPNK